MQVTSSLYFQPFDSDQRELITADQDVRTIERELSQLTRDPLAAKGWYIAAHTINATPPHNAEVKLPSFALLSDGDNDLVAEYNRLRNYTRYSLPGPLWAVCRMNIAYALIQVKRAAVQQGVYDQLPT